MEPINYPINIGVFISGNGSNLQAIIDNIENKTCHARIQFVLSNKADAFGLERARLAKIPTHIVDHKKFPVREDFDSELVRITKDYKIDLICLAGFMRVLTPVFLNEFDGRVLNIHPSLLPKFKGLHTHKRALEADETEHGCSVHIVTAELDDGPIITQRRVPVLPDDTEGTLNDRVLAVEQIAYTEAINIMAQRISGV